MRGWLALTLLVLLVAPSTGAPATLVGTIVERLPGRLMLQPLNGENRVFKLDDATVYKEPPGAASGFLRGDLVAVEYAGRPARAMVVYASGTHLETGAAEITVRGRVESVDPQRRRVTVTNDEGSRTFRIDPEATVVFRDDGRAFWLDLHKGQQVAVVHRTGTADPPARVVFDPVTFLIRQMRLTAGELLARGQVSRVEGYTEGMIYVRAGGGERAVRFDRNTDWALGARMLGPQDFVGVETLVFGGGQPPRASRIIGMRAVPYLFDASP